MGGMEGRIAAVIREYDGQGRHRTGTEVDHASARWLAERVREAGPEPTLEPFALRRVDPLPSFVESEGRRVDGLPLFDGGLTDERGVAGRIGPLGSDAVIGFVEAPPNMPPGGLREARRTTAHATIVVATRGGRPGLAAFNAPDFTAPFGPPVLQVSGEAGAWLAEQAGRGATARVVAAARRTDAEAFNVVATFVGTQPDLPPLVVMTPRSGWWHCASERGGGIACWLEAMRAVRAAATRRTVHFVASSGHELGHLGLAAFMDRRPALGAGALAWVHFGANIGAAQDGRVRLATSGETLERAALDALAAHAAGPPLVAPRGAAPNGEAHNVHLAGGRYVSLVGSNALFHLEADRWPEAVDVAAVARYARGFADLTVALARGSATMAGAAIAP